jgi:hypothetical protein
MRAIAMVWLVVGVAACSLGTDLDDLGGPNPPRAGGGGAQGAGGGQGGTTGGTASGAGGTTGGAAGGGATGGAGGGGGATGGAGGSGAGSGGDGGGMNTPPLKFVQGASSLVEQEQTTLTASVAAITSGNLVVVAVTINSDPGAKVVSIVDNAGETGNLYVSANQRSNNTNCDDATEIWYAKKAVGGATSVKVTADSAVRMDMWVLEFSGLGDDPLDAGDTISQQPGGSLVAAPEVTPSKPDAVIVSAVQTCNGITGIKPPNPFIPLNVQTDNNTAYYIANEPGSYGAVWNAGGTWNASTVSFK